MCCNFCFLIHSYILRAEILYLCDSKKQNNFHTLGFYYDIINIFMFIKFCMIYEYFSFKYNFCSNHCRYHGYVVMIMIIFSYLHLVHTPIRVMYDILLNYSIQIIGDSIYIMLIRRMRDCMNAKYQHIHPKLFKCIWKLMVSSL